MHEWACYHSHMEVVRMLQSLKQSAHERAVVVVLNARGKEVEVEEFWRDARDVHSLDEPHSEYILVAACDLVQREEERERKSK